MEEYRLLENSNKDIAEKIILQSYIDLMREQDATPSALAVARRAKLTIEKEAYDIIYGADLIALVTDDEVHRILSLYKHIHKHFGGVCYDAQERLFKNWYDFEQFLEE